VGEERTEDKMEGADRTRDEDKETPPPDKAGEDSQAQVSAEDNGSPREEESPEALQRELDEQRDQFLRLRAEFDNFRKRAARDQQQIRNRVNDQFMKDLLPILDDLERALESIPDEAEDSGVLKEGIELVLKSFHDTLGRHGLEEITALSQPFDPVWHEAVMVVETEDHPDNAVIEEIQKGYAVGDRVIRPSRVVVAKPASREE
jgi:molecular chaperone GrpE